MKFNKIKEITGKVEDIQKAIPLFSKILALDETKTKVKRTAPLPSPESEEVDKRTVYVVCEAIFLFFPDYSIIKWVIG